jgi:phage shock protein PspC (stress-responsive transcriptional regulator)
MEKKLTRNSSDKMVAGVASGLASYFQLDVTWVRIAFALAAFFGGGGIWIYIILWIAVPENKNTAFGFTDYKQDMEKVNYNLLGGLILIGLGGYFLLDEFDIIPYWFRIGKLWPLIFVAIGLSILFKGIKSNKETKDFVNSDNHKKEEETLSEENKNENS